MPAVRFPFGAPMRECGSEIPGESEVFVLGAYPSALHVHWRPPQGSGVGRIKALSVDNEPCVFWTGSAADRLIEDWAEEHFDPAWGTVENPDGDLNGSSGKWVARNIIGPLRDASLDRCFITDCLTTYRLSVGGERAVQGRFNAFARANPPLRPVAGIGTHPSEAEVVAETLRDQQERLSDQIGAAAPRGLITLGNAAGRVVDTMAGRSGRFRLRVAGYGAPDRISIGGVSTTWFPLAHPAAPRLFQIAHGEWLRRTGFSDGT